MTKGCIQGSVCGPTFWNLVLDELLSIPLPDGVHIQAFADDVLLIVKGRDTTAIEDAANTALDRIKDWGTSVKLEFSPNKTQAVAFTKAGQDANVSMAGVRIPFLNQMKLLGVIIDKHLKFIAHAKYVISKAARIFNRLCKFVRPT